MFKFTVRSVALDANTHAILYSPCYSLSLGVFSWRFAAYLLSFLVLECLRPVQNCPRCVPEALGYPTTVLAFAATVFAFAATVFAIAATVFAVAATVFVFPTAFVTFH